MVYISGEEGFSKTLKDKVVNNKIDNPHLFFADINSFEEITSEIARADAILIAPLIGRDTEMGILAAFLESETGVIAITGDVGTGKSRLLRSVAPRVSLRGHTWVMPCIAPKYSLH